MATDLDDFSDNPEVQELRKQVQELQQKKQALDTQLADLGKSVQKNVQGISANQLELLNPDKQKIKAKKAEQRPLSEEEKQKQEEAKKRKGRRDNIQDEGEDEEEPEEDPSEKERREEQQKREAQAAKEAQKKQALNSAIEAETGRIRYLEKYIELGKGILAGIHKDKTLQDVERAREEAEKAAAAMPKAVPPVVSPMVPPPPPPLPASMMPPPPLAPPFPQKQDTEAGQQEEAKQQAPKSADGANVQKKESIEAVSKEALQGAATKLFAFDFDDTITGEHLNKKVDAIVKARLSKMEQAQKKQITAAYDANEGDGTYPVLNSPELEVGDAVKEAISKVEPTFNAATWRFIFDTLAKKNVKLAIASFGKDPEVVRVYLETKVGLSKDALDNIHFVVYRHGNEPVDRKQGHLEKARSKAAVDKSQTYLIDDDGTNVEKAKDEGYQALTFSSEPTQANLDVLLSTLELKTEYDALGTKPFVEEPSFKYKKALGDSKFCKAEPDNADIWLSQSRKPGKENVYVLTFNLGGEEDDNLKKEILVDANGYNYGGQPFTDLAQMETKIQSDYNAMAEDLEAKAQEEEAGVDVELPESAVPSASPASEEGVKQSAEAAAKQAEEERLAQEQREAEARKQEQEQEQARLAREAEAKQRAEEEARKAEEMRKAEEAKQREAEEARKREEQEAKAKAEQEERERAEQAKKEAEATRQKEEQEAKQRESEQQKKQAEETKKREAEQEARLAREQAEASERQKQVAEAEQRAEEEARKAAAAAKQGEQTEQPKQETVQPQQVAPEIPVPVPQHEKAQPQEPERKPSRERRPSITPAFENTRAAASPEPATSPAPENNAVLPDLLDRDIQKEYEGKKQSFVKRWFIRTKSARKEQISAFQQVLNDAKQSLNNGSSPEEVAVKLHQKLKPLLEQVGNEFRFTKTPSRLQRILQDYVSQLETAFPDNKEIQNNKVTGLKRR